MLNLVKKDLKLWFKSKRIWTFILGVLIMVIISTSWHANKKENEGPAYVTIGVVDLDGSEYSKLMLSHFNESDLFAKYAKIIVGDRQKITRMFEQGELTMYLIVPKNFAQNLIDIQNIPMQAYISTEDKTRAIILKNMLEAYEKYISAVEINCVTLYEVMKEAGMPEALVNQVNVKISMDLVFTALGKADFFEVVELEEIDTVPIAIYYSFEILFLFISYLALLAGMDLLRDRRQGLLMRLISTGTKIWIVVTQKVLLYTVLVGSLISLLFLGIRLRGTPININYLFFLILYFSIASVFFMILGAILTKLPTFLLVSNVMILFGAILGGGMIPVSYLPEGMIKIAKATVNYWFINISTTLWSGNHTMSTAFIAMIVISILLGILLCTLIINRREGMNREDV